MLNIPTLLSTADSSIGKIEKSSLSQQTLMELLVAGLTDTSAFTHTGSYLEVSRWPGLHCVNDSVARIDWSFRSYSHDDIIICPGGSVDLQWIPDTVTHFTISNLKLEGSVETTQLPRVLISLRIDRNQFVGTFSIENLPHGLTRIDIYKNRLSGSLDMASLPPDLREFSAFRNSFSGTIDLTKLPKALLVLSLFENALEGSVNLETLPNKLKRMELKGNQFHQDVIRLPNSPTHQSVLIIEKNSFSKIVDANGVDREWAEEQEYVEVRF